MPTPTHRRQRNASSDPRDAFSSFYRRYSSDVFAFFARRVLDVEIARDLTAETFAQAFEHRGRFRGSTESEAAAWLFGIGTNLLSRYWRRGVAEDKAVRRLGIEVGDLSEEDIDRAIALADLDSLRRGMQRALSGLTERERAAVEMRIVGDRPYSEVSQALGISEQTARARVARGLRRLARRVDEFDRGECHV